MSFWPIFFPLILGARPSVDQSLVRLVIVLEELEGKLLRPLGRETGKGEEGCSRKETLASFLVGRKFGDDDRLFFLS